MTVYVKSQTPGDQRPAGGYGAKENEMTDEMTCRICGGDIASNRYPALKTHQSLSTCIKILRARAEAAEDDLRELRENTLLALGVEPADAADDMADGSIRYILGGLLGRLAELEADGRWRPVSERPANDAPVLALLESGEYKVARYVDKVGGVTLRYWRGTGGSNRRVAQWRPIIHHIKGE